MTRSKNDSFNQTIGPRLLQLRKMYHLSQMEMAQQMGLTFQQIQKYERGQNQIPLFRLHDMAKVFKMSDMKFFQYLMQTEDPTTDRLSARLRKLPPKVFAALMRLAYVLEDKA